MPIMKATTQPRLMTIFLREYHLPLHKSLNHIMAGIQKEKPDTNRADASESKSEKIGMASAMTQAMMVKTVTRQIQANHPIEVWM